MLYGEVIADCSENYMEPTNKMWVKLRVLEFLNVKPGNTNQ